MPRHEHPQRPSAAEISKALEERKLDVLRHLFPNGKIRGQEFVVGNLQGDTGESLKVSLNGKGPVWADFATGESGGDLLDLLAKARHGGDKSAAMRAAAALLGLSEKRSAKSKTKSDAEFAEALHVSPIPADAPPPPERHPTLGAPAVRHEYCDEHDRLLSYLDRYDTLDGKEIRPITLWRSERSSLRWEWKAHPDRPLYRLNDITKNPDKRVLAVEGEKAADAAAECFPELAVTTWAGGANAVDNADISPLAGRHITLWPDADEAGQRAMEKLAERLFHEHGTLALIVELPGGLPAGFDLADQWPSEWTMDTVQGLMDGALTYAPVRRDGTASETELPEHSEDAIALSFAEQHAENLRFVAVWNQWLLWTGTHWIPETTLQAFDMTRALCRKVATGMSSARLATAIASAKTVAAVERLARADRHIAATTDQWDVNDWILNTPRGTIDLRTGHIRPHRREDYCTRITAVPPGGDCPSWHAFLNRVTEGSTELQDYLQRLLGYVLTGSTQEHVLAFLHGTGANGKSVVLNTVSGILADFATSAPMETFNATQWDRHPTELAGLRGARLVTAVETDEGRRWAEAKLKALTGGDPIKARFMRQDFFEFQPKFKLLVAGNHKPGLRSVDEAIRRRLHLIPFAVTIPSAERDPLLTEKLKSEWPGILAWMIDGCLEWQRVGLQPPAAVLDATEDYLDGEDSIAQWLSECCRVSIQSFASNEQLFRSWSDWATRTGEAVGTQRRLLSALEGKGYCRARAQGGTRGFSGLYVVSVEGSRAFG
jgi:putative DNA primase/helicase